MRREAVVTPNLYVDAGLWGFSNRPVVLFQLQQSVGGAQKAPRSGTVVPILLATNAVPAKAWVVGAGMLRQRESEGTPSRR